MSVVPNAGSMTDVEDWPLVRPVRRGETVSEAVVLAVLAASERAGGRAAPKDVDQSEPLAHSLDPDALDSLFEGRFAGRVEFHWSGWAVAVDHRRRVVVKPRR